jgi:glycosyltransferase involved in cell wall biosynthesis
LKPLLDAVSSELIIVDTGSTDKTVEIAGRFTDKVYGFDWADDFSTARNFGLEKCAGEWFMYLDADEIFDGDLSEMLNFFTNGKLNAGYNSAAYMRKDYTNPECTTWVTATLTRITRRSAGLRFVNPIHEVFSQVLPPVYEFKTCASHYGYTDGGEKTKRNLSPLLREAQEKPDDLRVLIQLFKELPAEEKEGHLLRVVDKARSKKDPFSAVAFLRAMFFYYEQDAHETVLEYIDEYFKRFNRKDVLLLDIYVLKGMCLEKTGETEEAVKAFDAYFRHYNLYRINKLNKSPAMLTSLVFTDKNSYQAIKTHRDELVGEIGAR